MPATKEITGTMQHIRAEIQKNTFNKAARSFEVVFATETPVRQYNWDIGEFNEVLSCDPLHVRMIRANGGLPVFDSHYPRRAMEQLGRADNISFSNKEGKAVITLGARADDALIADIENGIVKGISVGYSVYRYMPESVIPGQTPTYRAVDWEPGEISFAPVQADPNSGIRTKETDGNHTIIIDNSLLKTNHKMTIAEIRAKASDEQKARLDAIILIARSAKLGDEKAVELFESEKTVEAIRSENPEFQAAPPKPENVDLAKIREEGSKEQKARMDAILLSTRAAKLSDTEAIDYFNSDKPIDEIRQAIIAKFVATDPKINGTNGLQIGKEAIDKKREAAEHVILHRISPAAFDLAKVDGARELRGYSISELANVLHAERTGKSIIISRHEMADMIFGSKRDISTSDFPILMENVMNKALRGDYNFAPEYWQMIARQTSVNDFRAKGMYQVESENGMKEIVEGGEIKYGKLVEGKETIKVKKYAEGIKFTREAFINDDLGAFNLIPSRFVLDWETIKGDVVWGLITDNGNMGDGKALFQAADHKNLATGAGSALAEAGLIAADLLFAGQTALGGKRKIRVLPKYLVVPNALKFTAKKLMTSITATKSGDVNVFNGAYEVITEARLTDADAWYLFADPSAIEGIFYAYLNGEAGLRSSRTDDFDSDSIKFAVRGEFGAAAIDFRGLQKNAGK